LIISKPQLGYYVIDLEKKDINDLYGLRTAIETLSLKKSIDKMPEDQLFHIRDIFSAEKEFNLEKGADAEVDHSAQYKQADWDLHYNLIVGYSESQIFSHISKHILNFFQLVWSLNISRLESIDEHIDTITAILDRDLDQAMAALTYHLTEAEQSKVYRLDRSSVS
jgi:DNA-binding GntR family transcriptional regulator